MYQQPYQDFTPQSLCGKPPLYVPLQSQSPSPDNTQQITEALAKVTQLHRLPQARPDVFRGEEEDKTTLFLWESEFDALIDSVPVVPRQKLHLLFQHLEGRAKKVVEQLQFMSDDPEKTYKESRNTFSEIPQFFDLKQIVTFPTRGERTLDLVLTNLKEYYKDPIQRPPHGLSDHMSVEVQPKDRPRLSDSRLTIKTRDLKPSNRLAMRTYLQEVDAHTLVGNAHGCAEKVTTFQSIIQHGLDSVLPLRSKTIHSRDPPWVNPALKGLIRRRQRALAENNQPMFRFLRNRVNRERTFCKQRYHYSKVSQLKECKPSAWWKEVKKLSGMSSAVRDSDELMRSLQYISEESLSASDLANLINDTFLSPMQDFTPLSAETF